MRKDDERPDLFGYLATPVPARLPPLEPPRPPEPPDEPPDDPLAGIPLEVLALYERLALEIRAKGWKRYSSDAILHRIRWHYHIERGMGDFKCNDHWTAVMARWFLGKHPEMEGFFELRRSPHRRDAEDD